MRASQEVPGSPEILPTLLYPQGGMKKIEHYIVG